MPLCLLLVLVLTNALAMASSHAQTRPPRQEVTVDIHGVMARVEVLRTFLPAHHRAAAGANVALLDFALPRGAQDVTFALRQVSSERPPLRSAVGGPGQRAKPEPWLPPGEPRDMAPPTIAVKSPADAEARHRLFVEGARAEEAWQFSYAFTAPLACTEGAWTLNMPGAVDLSPVVSAVRVRVHAPLRERVQRVAIGEDEFVTTVGQGSVTGRAPAQASWSVRLAAHSPASALATQLRRGHHVSSWIGLCRAPRNRVAALPEAVVMVLDVSRSVGPAGLSLERQYARQFLKALPAGTRWNAVLFDRQARVLFPVFRLPTQESLSAFDEALVPGILQNGTQPKLGMQVAERVLRQEAKETGRTPVQPWVVLLTDGSVGEAAGRDARSYVAWGGAAFVLVRPEGEEKPDPFGEAFYRRQVHGRTGIFRVHWGGPTDERVQADVADLASGGDWWASPPAGARVAVAPGEGHVWPVDKEPLQVSLTAADKTRRLRPRRVSLRLSQAERSHWSWEIGVNARAGVMALSPPAEDAVPAGDMDPGVLKNALALAYLPRARACYLNRTAATTSARDLAGRVRLALEIERGEILEAHVVSSSLSHPAIEACLVEAAYDVGVPRPVGRDAAVQAILNLVFKPATTPEPGNDAAFDRDIDILLAPVERTSLEADFRLIDSKGR